MMILRTALSDHRAEPVHAAAVGDALTVCGHRLDLILEADWDATPEGDTCPRCQHAVDVLKLVSAV
jgi:hypothetical protein